MGMKEETRKGRRTVEGKNGTGQWQAYRQNAIMSRHARRDANRRCAARTVEISASKPAKRCARPRIALPMVVRAVGLKATARAVQAGRCRRQGINRR